MIKKYNEIELLADITSGFEITLIILDMKGEILFSNWALDKKLGNPPKSLEQLAGLLASNPKARNNFIHYVHSTDITEIFYTEFDIKKINTSIENNTGTFKFLASPVTWKKKDAIAVRIKDITRESLLFDEVANLERLAAAGQIAAGITHEFNNILTAMMGWTQIAQRAAGDNIQVLDALRTIDSNAQRAKKIASDLLDITRPPSVDNIMSVSISDTLEETLKLLNWDINNANIKVYKHFEDSGTCKGSPTRLMQVFVNIIKNAIDATPPFGILDIIVQKQDENVVTTFSDSGSGIPDHLLENIFKPFFTTKSRDGSTHGGSGLGLSISKKIIEDTGGTINIYNREQGGAVVELSLPCSNTISKETELIRETPSTLPPGIAVLVVDDEPDICEMINTALSLRGAHVISATNGEKAVELCKREFFNAAFLDYSMDGLSGYELYKQIKNIQPDLPIIFMSGVELPKKMDPLSFKFLKKPFDLREIQIELHNLLQ
ncbi:MAG: hybrid sensor histidine kinase/response regulator [Deltaproteobacteria bacterium]|nr:hybrid sensor histidine kinase/response regulator [Deltaproteobacteria bacterium]